MRQQGSRQTNPKTEIVNCHIHTFTTDHTPRYFPARIVAIVRMFPFLIRFLRWLSSLTWFHRWTDWLARLENFHRTGSRTSQREVFREVLFYYPRSTRFVVLPLDLEHSGHGPVARRIREQHDELALLAGDPDYGRQLIPFANVHPDQPGAEAEFRRCIETLGFRGLKIYPRTGFAPDHEMLMRHVYPLCVERNIPVVTHCSRGGVYRKGWSTAQLDSVTEPDAYLPILGDPRLKDLRISLAHWGGEAEWIANLSEGFDPDVADARDRNWANRIYALLKGAEYPGLWTDISYTLFKFEQHLPLLKIFLEHPNVSKRVLFGSDFYMTRQEDLSEKAISVRLRAALGEDAFHRIAHVNPRVWLGETAETDPPRPEDA